MIQSLAMKQNKVLHISGNQYPPLEVNHHTKRIWQELAKGVDEYHILARAKDNKFHLYQESNIYLHLIPYLIKRQWIFFFTSIYLFRLISKYKINILLAQCPIIGGFWAAFASKTYRIPLMEELHSEEYFIYFKSKKLTHRWLEKIQGYTLRNATIIRSLTDKMTKTLAENGFSKNVVLVENRVNLNIFNKPKENFEIGQPIKIISVGSFVQRKGYEILIESLSKIPYQTQLTLIGGGPLKEKYYQLAKMYNNIDIQLIDWIEQAEMIDLISNSDIYIQPSFIEAMPRTILEAMALRMPIITTNVGVIEGVIIDRQNGIFVNAGDIKDIVNAISELIENKELRERIAQNAFADACNKYEWNKMFDIYRATLYNMKYANH
jgi:glycosyltransferase involved in cell wall biosynthesis